MRTVAITIAVVISVLAREARADEEPLPPIPPPSPAAPEPKPWEYVPSAPRPKTILRGLVAAGASYGAVWGLGSGGARIEGGLAFDVQRQTGRPYGITVALDIDLGSTKLGLAAGDWRLWFTGDLLVDRVRLSIGPEVGYTWMSRSTSTNTINAFGIGLRVSATVDVIHLDPTRAIFVAAVPETMFLRGTHDFFVFTRGEWDWRLSAVAGVRF